jgi:serine/threonine-protein kinase
VLRRFQREVDVIRRLAHPHVVQLYEAASLVDGRPYYAMEWIDGPSVEDALRENGPFTLDETVAVVGAVCSALAAAHAAGVVHRDLKASNVLLAPGDSARVVKVVDFGIAKLLDDDDAPRLTTTGARIGTPGTMAPEQLLGQPVGPAVDVYAVGVLIFQMLAGRLPFRAATEAELERLQLVEPAPRLREHARVPVGVDDLVRRCLEKDPAHRVPSVEALASALADVAAGAPPAPRVAASSVPAVALLVSSPDERMLDDARRACQDAGLPATVRRAGSFLAARALPTGPEGDDGARARLDALALALRLASEHRVAVQVHVAPAKTLTVAGATQIVGGELLAVDSWTTPTPACGAVAASPAALEGMDEETRARLGK